MFGILKISGNSMSPHFNDGDFLFILKKSKFNFLKTLLKPKPNNTVIFKHQTYGLIIKNIKSLNYQDNTFKAQGSNSESLTTEQIGTVNFEQITAKVIYHFKKPASKIAI